MPQRTKTQVLTSIQRAIEAASPQVRVDASRGPFFYLSAQGVAQPLADASADVERVAKLSTLQFPEVATNTEALATARAFGLTQGSGGFASGFAYVYTGRQPVGDQQFRVDEGATFATGENGGQVVAAVEARTLTANNAAAFFNPATRRYEVPVLTRALAAGEDGNIAPFTLRVITGGAPDFDGVINTSKFRGGTEPQDVRTLYTRVQQKFAGLDSFSRGGLLARVLSLDVDRIQAVSLTYSSEFPSLFYRLPDGPCVDVWVLNTPREVLTTETFVASAGQAAFLLGQKPALSLSSVFVNGSPATADLALDTGREVGRSTRELSAITLATPLNAGDLVDVTYSYDGVLTDVQADIDGYLNATTGALFASDVLVRYMRTLPVVVAITGSVLGTFDPTTVEQEVTQAVGAFLAAGAGNAALVGGLRAPSELRDALRAQVAGIANLNIQTFCRKSLGSLVETIDIPRNAQVVLETSSDLFVRFT